MEGTGGTDWPLRAFWHLKLYGGRLLSTFMKTINYTVPYSITFPDCFFISSRHTSKRLWVCAKVLWVYSHGNYIVGVLAHSDWGRVYFNIFLQEEHLSIMVVVCLLQNSAAYLRWQRSLTAVHTTSGFWGAPNGSYSCRCHMTSPSSQRGGQLPDSRN